MDPWRSCTHITYDLNTSNNSAEFREAFHPRKRHRDHASTQLPGRASKRKPQDFNPNPVSDPWINCTQLTYNYGVNHPVEFKDFNSNFVQTTGLTSRVLHGDSSRNEQRNCFGGMIFGCCSKQMWRVCKDLHLFGLGEEHSLSVLKIVPGMKLFLFNFQSKRLAGVFQAVSRGGINLVPGAFDSLGYHLPAQVGVKRILKCPRLPVDLFASAIQENFYSKQKFTLELTADQVARLVNLFTSAQQFIKPV